MGRKGAKMEQISILRKLAWCMLLLVAVLSVVIITADKTLAAGDTAQIIVHVYTMGDPTPIAGAMVRILPRVPVAGITG